MIFPILDLGTSSGDVKHNFHKNNIVYSINKIKGITFKMYVMDTDNLE